MRHKVLNQVFVIILMNFLLVTGDITVTADNDTDVEFKNCAPFSTGKTEINDMFIDEANHIYNAMSM